MRNRHRRRVRRLAAIGSALLPLLPFVSGDAAAQMVLRTENFNVDPGWDGHNNRSTAYGPAAVTQNYGYSSNRVGGTINPSGEISYFAQNVSNASFDTTLTASGTLNNNGGGNSWIGFFNSGTANEWRSANSLSLRIYGRGSYFIAYPEYGTSTWRAGADGFVSGGNEVQFPINTNLNWSLSYNPSGNGGGGTITAILNGVTVVKNLDAGHKADGATFNRFGLGAINKSYDSPGQLFIDNVVVNGGSTQTFTGGAPGWSGVNNNASYNTNNVRFRFDFGYSNTNHAGGAGAGEAGGNFFRGDSRFADRMAFYGDELDQTLTLNQSLHAHGKVTFKRGVTDSTVLFGFFHDTDSVRVSTQQANGLPENFVGGVIEGPSAEGFFFYPSYGTDSEGQNASGRGIGAQPYIYPDSTTHDWTIDYDPGGNGGNGQIIVSLDGQQAVMNLQSGHKGIGAHFNRFGFVTTHIDGNGQTVFIDDVTYTVGFGGGSQWAVNNSGEWNVPGNWTGAVPNAVGAHAVFGSNNTAGRAVLINDAVTVGTLEFSSNNAWLITGLGTLTLEASPGPAHVNVQQGSHKINLPLTVASDTEVNVVAGAQLRISDAVTVAAGKNLAHTGAGTVTYESIVTLGSGASMSFTGAAELASLSMADGSAIDLRRGSLAVSGDDYDSMLRRVQQGHNGGDWLGDGITSSAAASDLTGGTGLGIVDADGPVRVKYTVYGDADLTGFVTREDFDRFLAGFSAGAADWIDGDFDLSGYVDLADFDRMYLGLRRQGGADAALMSALGDFVAAHGLSVDLAAIPEPSGAAILAVAGALRLRRQRQQMHDRHPLSGGDSA